MSTSLIFSIGILAQFLFASRLIAQWIVSEKQRKVLAPTIFWILSLIASILLFIYGYLRNDLAIMIGQLLTYFIYIRNLQLQDKWHLIPSYVRWFIIVAPLVVLLFYVANNTISISNLLNDPEIPLWLVLFGITSQLIFTMRFIVQWVDSEKQKQSLLPLSFWIMSIIGAFLTLIYAVFRSDWVLILGHCFGMVIYIRNIQLGRYQSRLTQSESKL